MKILSVEDVLVVRKMIERVVEGMGGSFLEASGGLEALRVLEANDNIDLILLDWNMPNMDGFEFLSRVKSIDKFKNIPVIMVSNENDKGKIIRSIQAGAANYLSKPFTDQDLTKKIVDCLGLGYESLLTRCFSNTIKSLINKISGQEVKETKWDKVGLPGGKFFGQFVVLGQKNALVLFYIDKGTVIKIMNFLDSDNQTNYSNENLAEGTRKIANVIYSRSVALLSDENTGLDLSAPFFFAGQVEKSTLFINKVKNFSVAKSFGSGDVEFLLKIIYL